MKGAQKRDVDLQPEAVACDDRGLVERLSHGQLDAMADVYERHSTHAHILASNLWGADKADQIVQDVFAQLSQSPHSYDAGRSSLAVHLSMQVRLWTPPAQEPASDARQMGGHDFE